MKTLVSFCLWISGQAWNVVTPCSIDVLENVYVPRPEVVYRALSLPKYYIECIWKRKSYTSGGHAPTSLTVNLVAAKECEYEKIFY